MKRHLKSLVLFLCFLLAVTCGLFYADYSSDQIQKESADHLQEVYTQINTSIATIASNNWNILHEWEDYIAHISHTEPQMLASYIEENQQRRKFTEFYFISENGDYRTVRGDRGYLNLGQGLRRLMINREDVVVDSDLPSGEKLFIFAVPVEKSSIGSFEYSAIAMAYTTEAMASALKIEAFSGQGVCYVAYQDGRILFNSRPEEASPYNIVTYLREHAEMKDKNIAEVLQDWIGGTSDVVRYEMDGTWYYFSYQPVGFSDWLLLGVVPVEIVNAAMNQYTIATLAAMGVVCILVVICILIVLISNSQKHFREQALELEFREGLFDILTQHTDDVFLLFSGEDYKASYVSSNIERVLGVRVSEVLEDIRSLSRLLVEGSAEAITREILEGISEDTPWISERSYHNPQTGQVRHFKAIMRHAPIRGKRDLFVMAMSDRTEEQRMNLALEDALNAANAANDAKRNFLANMSHDIRTPMNAIMGFSALMSKEAHDPFKVREYTRKISISSQHLMGLINDILDMSKIESGKTALINMEFCLPTLLEEIVEMLVPQAKMKQQDFEVRTQGVLPEYLLGDKIRLHQILTNLLTNALKYTPEKGRIRMTVEALEDTRQNYAHLRFTVEDNGCGMSPEFLKHIFTPFTRERKMYANEIQGTGLGMAITNTLVKLMGGTIHIESTPDVGSVFTVELLFALADHAQDNDFWKRNKIERVLVVDDEEDVCLNIQLILRGVGVEVDYATNGYQALELAASAHDQGADYAVVLIDWKMPGIDGQETARLIRQKTRMEVPILMITAFVTDEIEDAARADGIDKFLPKPFFLSYFQLALEDLYRQRMQNNGQSEESASEISIAGLRVLAAEDQKFNADLLVELLRIYDVSCDMTSNGQEAYDTFMASEPGYYDIVILDIQMPVMDGHEVSRKIRSSSRPDAEIVPIIAMTANAFEDDIHAAMDAGMNAHATKPIGKEKLRSIIQKHCKR